MFEAFGIFMRWEHIASVATLVGGMLYGWLVLAPATRALAAEARQALTDQAAALFRPLAAGATTALILSGGYNLATNPGHHTRYYILLSIKLLLAAHVFAVGIVASAKTPNGKALSRLPNAWRKPCVFSLAVINRMWTRS